MAFPIDFKGSNLILKAPPGRDDVEDLYVMRNRAMVVSCWALEDEEIEEILLQKRIFLSVLGQTMQPSFVGSQSIMRGFTADYGILPKS